MKRTGIIFIFLCGIFSVGDAQIQSAGLQKGTILSNLSFIEYQKTFPRPNDAFKRKVDTLMKQFEAKNLKWPARYIYIRSFKYDSQLEIWVKNEKKEPFKLFNTYKVCALAGTLGPKRMEGDYQVPEGFYYINEFNPRSSYHLSLGINYPNVSDRILSDKFRPGGEIYIHGSCVTVGCIPLTDPLMEDVYIIASYAKSMGQDFIPVHIFPVRFNVKRSTDYLNDFMKDDLPMKKFASRMEDAFNYFEKNRQLPVIIINEQGEYYVYGAPPKKHEMKEEPVVKKPSSPRRTRNITDIPAAVHQQPLFPGGNHAYTRFLEELGKDMAAYLPDGVKKLFLRVEFIVDKDGVPVNFKTLRSVNEDFDDELLTRLENMGKWKPALLHDKPVAKKIVQTFTIEAD
jgi:murein L,D-transpeptidase YafK